MPNFQNYILLKPDSVQHCKKLENEILARYKIIHKYYVSDYLGFCKIIRAYDYKYHKEMYNTMLLSANLETKLFGNSCVLLSVQGSSNNIDEFLLEMFMFKKEMRKKYGIFSGNRACLAVNLENNYTEFASGSLSGEIFVCNKNKLQKSDSMRCKNGLWNFVTFSLIHIPGPSADEVQFANNAINQLNLPKISAYKWGLMKKYSSYNIGLHLL